MSGDRSPRGRCGAWAGCCRPPGLHPEDSRWLQEYFEHRAARSKGRGSRTPEKKIIMNEKVLRVQIFFKTYLESKFEAMFLN